MKISKEEVKQLYLSGKTLKEIAKIAECNWTNIRGHLKRMGVPRRLPTQTSRKYKVNENYFEVIDTEEKAYILGFLYADGYNNHKKGSISIRLHNQDIDILYKIKSCLEYEGPLMIKEQYCDLTIACKKISDDLNKLGCTQGKSLTTIYPKSLGFGLDKHFIRGYFDGDGCISIGKDVQLTLLGTQHIILSIQAHLMMMIEVNKTKLSQRIKASKTYTMRYKGKNNVRKITDYLYRGASIYLDRKYNKYCTLSQ